MNLKKDFAVMKLHIEINDRCYYLGKLHQRLSSRLYDEITHDIKLLLDQKQLSYKIYQAHLANVKTVLFKLPNTKIKLTCNSDHYEITGTDLSDQPIKQTVMTLTKKAISHGQ